MKDNTDWTLNNTDTVAFRPTVLLFILDPVSSEMLFYAFHNSCVFAAVGLNTANNTHSHRPFLPRHRVVAHSYNSRCRRVVIVVVVEVVQLHGNNRDIFYICYAF